MTPTIQCQCLRASQIQSLSARKLIASMPRLPNDGLTPSHRHGDTHHKLRLMAGLTAKRLALSLDPLIQAMSLRSERPKTYQLLARRPLHHGTTTMSTRTGHNNSSSPPNACAVAAGQAERSPATVTPGKSRAQTSILCSKKAHAMRWPSSQRATMTPIQTTTAMLTASTVRMLHFIQRMMIGWLDGRNLCGRPRERKQDSDCCISSVVWSVLVFPGICLHRNGVYGSICQRLGAWCEDICISRHWDRGIASHRIFCGIHCAIPKNNSAYRPWAFHVPFHFSCILICLS